MTTYPNQNIQGQVFPSITGTSIAEEEIELSMLLEQELIILLTGNKQDSQFDIDRWLIGLDKTETELPVYELPTIQGMFPRMFRTFIYSGMRRYT